MIYCDIDGVLADMVTASIMRLYYAHGFVLPPDEITEFNIAVCAERYLKEREAQGDDAAIPRDEILDTLLEAWNSPGFLLGLQPHGNMWAVLIDLLAQQEVCFLTARDPGNQEVEDATRQWLSRFGFSRCHCIHTLNKVEYLCAAKDKDPDCTFIEDRRKTAEQAASRGIRSLLVARPWNTQTAVMRLTSQGLRTLLLD